MNPECRTLVVCRSELVKGIVSIGPEEVAADLLEKQLISSSVHKEILQSSNSTNDKAKSLVAAVIYNVRINPGVQFRKFKAILSRNRKLDLVQLLEDKFGADVPKDSYEEIERTNVPKATTQARGKRTAPSVSPRKPASTLPPSPVPVAPAPTQSSATSDISPSSATPNNHVGTNSTGSLPSVTTSSPVETTPASSPVITTASPPGTTSASPPLVTTSSPPGISSASVRDTNPASPPLITLTSSPETTSASPPEDSRSSSPCPLHGDDFFKWLRQNGIGARDIQILKVLRGSLLMWSVEEDIRVIVYGLYQEDEELCKQLSKGTAAILKYSSLKADLLRHFGGKMCRHKPGPEASPKKKVGSSLQTNSSVQQEEIEYSRQEEPELTDADLGEVFVAVKNACGKWYEIGLELKVDPAALSDIEVTIKPLQGRLRETLRIWLLNGGYTRTWVVLAETMKSRLVGRSDIADRIL